MKYRKIIICLVVFFLIYLIYRLTMTHSFTYLALGDSLAIGQNPYGAIGYGYSDYVANYLEKNDLLKFYTKEYSKSGARSTDLLQDIQNNKKIVVDGKEQHLKVLLREADLITISIGANDFFGEINIKNLDSISYQAIDNTIKNVDTLLGEIRKYNKKNVLVIGYYNPFPKIKEFDPVIDYVDSEYEDICKKHKVTYIKVSLDFRNSDDVLPNPIDIHPNTKGYSLIANKIIDEIESNILNQ